MTDVTRSSQTSAAGRTSSADVTADDVETFTAGLADELLAAGVKECLACYLLRMLHQFDCDGTLRFTRRWRDEKAPRAKALERRLAAQGACCCDCEVMFNVVEPSQELQVWNIVLQRYEPPSHMPSCAGNRPRSTQPCANWRRRRR